ncbi:hypothetical protein I862_03005 [endosymbiont of Acanthamoeba sp. UWC8]|uniref:ankyrin repeat domain-containing protein n=1 Tax=endosymbiont of Acanthamoeba sp. UWC8 TaxID=86106 RepID=UPI0004D1E949|nr:ankyrin repeat domain-containing protein [endosymbiont of Acanthamoeba sp. UWC8]AIF81164.1 hypothetical protein I862_03005 [endosymbiont of Acanthamoeba sp. UWC8]
MKRKLISKDHDNSRLLIDAIKEENWVKAKKIIKNADTNKQDSKGWTPLMLILDSTVPKLSLFVEILKKNDTNINIQNRDGDTTLIIAARKGNTKAVEMLFKYKPDIDINIINKLGDDAFISAILSGEIGTVKLIFEAGYKELHNIYYDEEHESFTVLTRAARLNFTEAIEFLIAKGADVNFPSNEETALTVAAQYGCCEALSILLGYGANVEITDHNGNTALILAADNGHEDIVNKLISAEANVNYQDDEGRTALMLAAEKGYIQIVGDLLNAKANPNLQDHYGNTALMLISNCDNMKIGREITQTLITHSANLDLQNEDKWTALMLALENDHFSIAKIYIEEGADVNISDEKNYTALIYAMQNNANNSLVELIIAKADDETKLNALMYAIENDLENIAQLLIAKIVNINEQINNTTPLIEAVRFGRLKIINQLIIAGAALNEQDAFGKTALIYAYEKNYNKIFEILIKAGAKISDEIREVLKNKQNKDTLLASDTPTSTVANLKKEKPNYLINTIAYVPYHEEDLEELSSDEELDGEFTEEMFNFNPGNLETMPYRAIKTLPKNQIQDKLEDASAGTLLRGNVPIKKERIKEHDLLSDKYPKSTVIEPFLQKLAEQAFNDPNESNQNRFAVSFALNRPRSLSTRRNHCLFREMSIQVGSEISHEKFGMFWDFHWYDSNGKPVVYHIVRSFYKQLKRYDEEKAESFRTINEDGIKHKVPYQALRERLRIHENTKNYVKYFREIAPNAPIYFSFIDIDVVSFNNIYTAYDQIYMESTSLPTIMTTGYEFPSRLEDLPININQETKEMMPALSFISQLDRAIRIAVAKILPCRVYYPEPNTCVLLSNNESTLPESFVAEDNAGRQKGDMESVHLLRNIIKSRSNIAIIFSDKNPIITTIPDRCTRNGKGFIQFSSDFKAGGSPSMDDLKLIRQPIVSQSHCADQTWANNMVMIEEFSIEEGIDKGWGDKKRNIIGLKTVLKEAFKKGNPLFFKSIEEIKELDPESINPPVIEEGIFCEEEDVEKIKEAVQATHKTITVILKNHLFRTRDHLETELVSLDNMEIEEQRVSSSQFSTFSVNRRFETQCSNTSQRGK